MKKLLISALAAAALFTVTANAEEGVYLRQLPQYSYINCRLLTQESYPEVCIFPGYPSSLFSSYSDTQPYFLCFPGPDGALADTFSSYEATYLDDQNNIQYGYSVTGSDSFEEFVNEAEDDSWILLDGSDGTAARIDPDGQRAYGMIATKEFGKSSKLIISIRLDSLDSKMPLETRVQALSDAILAEVSRVSGSMHDETIEPYWSAGKYKGIKILDDSFQHLLTLDLPVFTVNYTEGGSADAPIYITDADRGRVEGFVDFGNDANIEVEIDYDDYSYAVSNFEDGTEGASEQTLDNGSKWILYISNKHDDGTAYAWYASKNLGFQNEYGDDVYLTVYMSADQIYWADEADIMSDVAKFDNYTIVDPAEDPYVPGEAPAAEAPAEEAPAEEAAPAADGTWTCPDCGQENAGNFCANCGAAKPAPAEWTCPDCGQVNTGNFCANCGKARP